MIGDHATLPLEDIDEHLRPTCPHAWVWASKEPVLPPFLFCPRCGRWERA